MSEVNNLPKHWQEKSLKEIVSLLGDGLHGTPKYDEKGDYFFINGNNLDEGKIVIKENTKRVSKEEYQKHKKNLTDRTILVSINGTLGNIAFYNNEKVILGKSACYFNLLEGVDKKYVSLILSGQRFLSYAQKTATGSTIQNVSLKSMRDFKIPLPPIQEQQSIVSKLEELFSELDNGIENLSTAQRQLKTYRQSVLKWAFEGRLTNKNIKDGDLPDAWKWVKLGELTDLITKGASPKWQGFNYTDDATQLLFVTSENVRDNFIDVSEPKFLPMAFNNIQKRSILKFGDVLFNLVGASIGRAAVYNLDTVANINQAVAVIRLKEDLNNKYLAYFLNSVTAKRSYMANVVDVARANLSLTETAVIKIPHCSLKEQQAIVEAIESRLSVADKLEETISQSLQQAEALRQSILKRAFEGKLI